MGGKWIEFCKFGKNVFERMIIFCYIYVVINMGGLLMLWGGKYGGNIRYTPTK